MAPSHGVSYWQENSQLYYQIYTRLPHYSVQYLHLNELLALKQGQSSTANTVRL